MGAHRVGGRGPLRLDGERATPDAAEVLSARTVKDLFSHFAKQNQLILLPLLLVLLLAAVLLVLTQGLAYVTPFVYALF